VLRLAVVAKMMQRLFPMEASSSGLLVFQIPVDPYNMLVTQLMEL